MDQVQLVVYGRPVPKQRPRVTRSGAYTPKRTRDYEKLIRAAWIDKQLKRWVKDGVYRLRVFAMYEAPRSWPKRKQEMAIGGRLPMVNVPDWDNVGKIVSDALNGLAWEDDKQVVDARVLKEYGLRPALVVEIENVSGNYDMEESR